MSHNIHIIGHDTSSSLALVVFTSYTTGGETFTIAEFGFAAGTFQKLFIVPARYLDDQQCEVVPGPTPFVPKVILLSKYGTPAELPTTASLNLQVLLGMNIVGA